MRVDRIKELLPHFNGEYVVVLKDGTRLKLSHIAKLLREHGGISTR